MSTSARVGGRWARRGEAPAQPAQELDGGVRRVGAAVQMAQAPEALEGQGEDQEQPVDLEAPGVVVGDVAHAVAVLGVVGPLVLHLLRLLARW